jgi:hypothetical protein
MIVSERGAAIAAGRLSITVREYWRHRAEGKRHCGKCRQWLPLDAFYPSLLVRCRACQNADARRRQRLGRQTP